MALIETSLIWVAYAVCLAILALIAGIFVFVYQKPGERTVGVTVVCFVTVLALLATVLLLPVDIALTSATTSRKLGAKKEWATPDAVDAVIYQLTIVYYTLYSLDAVLCLLIVPFTYFLYEEYDEVAAEDGQQTLASRIWGAFKYTIAFILLVVILFLVGFFIPVAKQARDEHKDLGFFKDLLTENHGERALTFSVGILITIGVIVYSLYTAPGLALLPLALIKSAPRVSAPQLAATTSSHLEQNRERRRQLEGRNEGSETGLNSRDRAELENLIREERTLVRRERLAAENQGEGHAFVRIWNKTEAIFRPLKLIGGLLLLVISLIIFASMLITCVDKIKNSSCKVKCGYILGETQIFQPVNWLLTLTSKVFPIDYIIFLLLTLLFFCATIVGLATIGIRFLWVHIFSIRKGHTSPNAMLLATVLLTLSTLALNYALAMIVAPQYATFGPQTYCDRPTQPGEQPNCKSHHSAIKPCSERADNPVAHLVCTPSVGSTFLNRITVNFPFLGAVDFWAQFAFLAIFLIVFLVMLFRVPKLDEQQLDDDLREEEEEGLLASTGRRFGATWQDITGRARGVKRADYGATSRDGATGSGLL
nr:putative lysosomal cobalamin transporter [Quercus suber]